MFEFGFEWHEWHCGQLARLAGFATDDATGYDD